MPHHILMVAPTSFFGDYGGHIRIYEETLALQRLGHRVTIVTYYKGRDLPGLDIRRTAPLPWRTDYEVGSSRHKLAFDLYLLPKVLQVARRMRPTIVHGHMHEGALIGALAARLLRVPLVFDYQGSLSAEMVDHNFLRPEGVPHRTVRRLERLIDRLPHAILTSSLQARDQLITEFSVPPSRIHPLPDCVDLQRFDPQRQSEAERNALRQAWGLPSHRPVIACLGLLADYQGTADLVRAAALLQAHGEDVHFLIMGYPNVERYQAMAQQLGVAGRVTFTGKVAYDDAPRLLALGDVAVSAKRSRTEGSGKLLNYMALAQPVVAYDTPVHREYLGEWGIYPAAGDVVALATALRKIVAAGPEYRRKLGQKLRQRAAAHYDWQQSAEKITTLYDALSAAGRAPATPPEAPAAPPRR